MCALGAHAPRAGRACLRSRPQSGRRCSFCAGRRPRRRGRGLRGYLHSAGAGGPGTSKRESAMKSEPVCAVTAPGCADSPAPSTRLGARSQARGISMSKGVRPHVELDEFDIKLLDALQENNQRTSEELADLVHLSPASCLRRAKRLRETKVISADVSIVAPEVIGPRMTMIVMVSLEREQHDLIDAFRASMRANSQVTQCYYVTGTVDFVMFISVRDMTDYETFTRH